MPPPDWNASGEHSKDTAGIRAIGLPIDRDDLERRLETALLFYVSFRPHEGLDGDTPGDPLLGLEPRS